MQSYRLCSKQGILKRDYGDDCVVYLSASRQTHLLGAMAAQVLSLLEQAPSSANSLVDAIKPHFEDASVSEVSILLDEVVDCLSRIAVIESFEDVS